MGDGYYSAFSADDDDDDLTDQEMESKKSLIFESDDDENKKKNVHFNKSPSPTHKSPDIMNKNRSQSDVHCHGKHIKSVTEAYDDQSYNFKKTKPIQKQRPKSAMGYNQKFDVFEETKHIKTDTPSKALALLTDILPNTNIKNTASEQKSKNKVYEIPDLYTARSKTESAASSVDISSIKPIKSEKFIRAQTHHQISENNEQTNEEIVKS